MTQRKRDEPDSEERRRLRLGIAVAIFDAAVDGVAAYLKCDRERARRLLMSSLAAIEEEQ